MAKLTAARVQSFGHCFDEGVLRSIIEWIGANLDPEDVFDDEELANWALNNGFVVKRR